eukprot:Opistho-2@68206
MADMDTRMLDRVRTNESVVTFKDRSGSPDNGPTSEAQKFVLPPIGAVDMFGKSRTASKTYPPVLKHKSWTKASPWKEERHFHRISDSIGNNYSPAAQELNMKAVASMQKLGASASLSPMPGHARPK